MREKFRDFVDYILWRDMGNLGEGCFISLFYWAIIIGIIALIIGAIVT